MDYNDRFEKLVMEADLNTPPPGSEPERQAWFLCRAKQIVENRYGLVCDQCEGSITGASNAYIHCDGNIRVSLSGASDLHYTRDANTTGSTTSVASNIIHDVLP